MNPTTPTRYHSLRARFAHFLILRYPPPKPSRNSAMFHRRPAFHGQAVTAATPTLAQREASSGAGGFTMNTSPLPEEDAIASQAPGTRVRCDAPMTKKG